MTSISEMAQIIDEVYENPYPKDIFLWDSPRKVELTAGRLHELMYKAVEQTKKDIIRLIREHES